MVSTGSLLVCTYSASEDGTLVVRGRSDDLINVSGILDLEGGFRSLGILASRQLYIRR